MRKYLRIASLSMLIVAILFVVFAFMTMDVPIHYPYWLYRTLKLTYKVYPVIMVLLFAASLFVRDGNKAKSGLSE